MATRITPSQLDFTSIKQNLKAYFKDSGEFNDYNFEGSGLSAILDVLAYDTHMKALTANFSLNEAFLDTAQLRGSVVSHAKSLNYLPGSRNSARAVLDVTVIGASGIASYTLPKYTRFTTTTDGTTFSFYTLDEYKTDQAANFIFEDIDVYEGNLIKKRFIVDADVNDNPIYVIPDKNVYTDSINIVVRDGLRSNAITSYRLAKKVEDFALDQEIYFLNESANGFYEITFGDGKIGKVPAEGSIIEVTYLSSTANASNGASIFGTSTTLDSLSLSAATVTSAYGGAERESIESIRFNAPKGFASQDRAVTESDFVALIQNAVTYIESINVYGGQRANPPEYGKVYIAIKPIGADALNAAQKSQLLENTLNDRVILSITPELIDPTIQYLEISANIFYDDSKTTLTEQQLDTAVKNEITLFGTTNLLGFQSPFRLSSLTTAIDRSNVAILSSSASVKLQKRFIPILNTAARYDLEFTEAIAAPSTQDYILSSDEFEYTVDNVAYTCNLRNKTGTAQLEIYRKGVAGDIIVVDDAGSIDFITNIVSIIPFSPSSISDSINGIRVSVVPSNQNTINPDKNILLRFDEDNISVTATKDTV